MKVTAKKDNLTKIVLLICEQIRMAMNKQLRIYCANLLTKIDRINEDIINQMMQKE